jgi:hypothetical protein
MTLAFPKENYRQQRLERKVADKKAWEKVKAELFKLDGHRCANPFCLSTKTRTLSAIDPHHIKGGAERQASLTDLNYLIPLCRLCHDYAHGKLVGYVNKKDVTADEFMLWVLQNREVRPHLKFRHGEALEYMRAKVERNKAKKVRHDG